jgi:hypothetical protein
MTAEAQVSAVEFGKNRIQYKKFKWQYYQTKNFNVYFTQNGKELGKFVAQVAEVELPGIELFTENNLQRRVTIIVYNEFADFKQSNIGLSSDWQNTGGLTKLVNNKMIVWFNGDHNNLKTQIREGIAKVITENTLFGGDLGEIAGNQTLLDLPQWLTDGYIAFTGENWSTALDDELKSEMLSGNYRNFHQFAFEKPLLAGHSFWYYIQEKYKKENVTYLLYLARIYKNMNKACLQVCKKKFRYVLTDFMEYQEDKYEKDIARRKPFPKGKNIESFDINDRLDYYRINVNPIKGNNSYALVKFKKGIVRLIINQDDNITTLLKYGIRSYKNQTNPTYPIMAWDPKGTRLTVIHNKEGKPQLFVYDLITNIKPYKIDLSDKFDQVLDVKYFPTSSNMLLLSAVKNGHTDIFTFTLDKEKIVQITNDVYDDLDPSVVSFPNKTGIIFSSNRPNAEAKTGDTALPSNNRYNVFLVTDYGNKAELNQITQLSKLKYGNARYPMQYNENHFTFINDENGIGNRYAGFFNTKKEGLDTLVIIGDNILRNPSSREVDSALDAHHKTDVDSIAVVSISKDSAYTFPLSNYPSSVSETRIAGQNNQVSEVTRQSDEKILYKLKIDDITLKKRNISTTPTSYMKNIVMADKIVADSKVPEIITDSTKKKTDIFQSEFENEKEDSSLLGKTFKAKEPENYSVLKNAKLFRYKPVKFSTNYAGIGLNNTILINRYQTYMGGSGPINLSSNTPLNGLIKIGTSELLEDIVISGAYKISTNLKDNEWFMNYQNYRRRVDWGVSYYRNVEGFSFTLNNNPNDVYPGKTLTNLYQANVSYPFDESKSIRLTTGIRNDKIAFALIPDPTNPGPLDIPTENHTFETTNLQFVYDNTLNPAMNIWHGLRYKVYFDWNTDISKEKWSTGKYNFNWGFDTRYYYPIYRNFIWAGRAAADFSWGDQKTIYYLGGADGWLMLGGNVRSNGSYRYFNQDNRPANDQSYAFQTLANNLRGFTQNVANGNNALVLNSEFRLPVLPTLMNRSINNAFLRNFQIIQFIDLGTAWNGSYGGIKRPVTTYTSQGTSPATSVSFTAGGVGPFAAGYGFGARSTLLGYFLKFDAGWPMNGFFRGKPVMYLALGLDF